MAAQILPMPGIKAPAQTAGHFVRLGETGHRQLADLHAEGRFSPQRVVVDASRLHYQKELISALRKSRTPIVLDTKAAELAAEAKFAGFARGAPWAECGNGRPLGPDHYEPKAASDVLGRMARFAVEHQVDAILAPGHFLSNGAKSVWFGTDQRACIALRRALDREGGPHIRIDYQLLLPHVILDEVSERGEFAEALEDLPFDNLWLRASGFGSDAGPLTTHRYIKSLLSLHNIGKPIVADYLGGLISLAAVSFGAISGFAEGIGERERFDAREWDKPPMIRGDDHTFGQTKRIAITDFGRTVTATELQKLYEAKGGRRLVACGNRDCCPHGLPDMLRNPKRHSVYQRQAQIRESETTPDLNRAQHFLDGAMIRANRLAWQIKELRTSDEKLMNRLVQHSRRMEKLRLMLEHFHDTEGRDAPRALAVIERQNASRHKGGNVEYES
jgi:hypothetical protein